MRLPVTFASALAIHAVAAVGVAAFGVPHGRGDRAPAGTQTIDVEPALTMPVVQHEPAPRTTAHAKESSRGASTPVPVRIAAVETAAPLPTQEPIAPRFKMSLAAQVGAPVSEGHTEATGFAGAPDVAERDVTERAQKVGGILPTYPPDARAQGVELGAPLAFEIVVDTRGQVSSARALGHAGYGFDEAALIALRTYRFSPARRNGQPVAVRMRWNVEFHLD